MLVIADHDEMLRVLCEQSGDVAFEDFGSFFDDDNFELFCSSIVEYFAHPVVVIPISFC